jgi:pimeloyl-ACP methyl ester carboxylesterase
MRLAPVVLIALAACRPPSGSASDPQVIEQAKHHAPTAFTVEVRGHGRPVILIPGLGCPSSVWGGMVEHLRDHETHALTLAGFAGNPRIDEPLLATTVEQLARYIRDRHLESPIIIGHSLGGSLAYWLAAREPALVGPMIIVDAGAPAGTDLDSAAQTRDMWRRLDDERFVQQVKDTFGQMSAKPAQIQPVIAAVARSDRRAIGDAIYELSATNLRNQLGNIRAPVLLVLADGSLQDAFRREASGVPRREVVVVPNTGHFVMLDEPTRFFAAVDGFLAKHEAVAAN